MEAPRAKPKPGSVGKSSQASKIRCFAWNYHSLTHIWQRWSVPILLTCHQMDDLEKYFVEETCAVQPRQRPHICFGIKIPFKNVFRRWSFFCNSGPTIAEPWARGGFSVATELIELVHGGLVVKWYNGTVIQWYSDTMNGWSGGGGVTVTYLWYNGTWYIIPSNGTVVQQASAPASNRPSPESPKRTWRGTET